MIAPTAAQLRAHAFEIAAAFHVELFEDPTIKPDEAAAQQVELGGVTVNVVRVAPIIDVTTYAVAMHEIGHHVSALGTLGDPQAELLTMAPDAWFRRRLTEETAAWDWAAHYALEWTPVMQSVRDWGFGTYQKAAEKAADASRAAQAAKARDAAPPRLTVGSATDFAATIRWRKPGGR